MKYLFLGASNTDCDHCFTPDNLGKGYVKFFALRQAFAGDTVINGGTNGFTYPRILQKYLAFYRKNALTMFFCWAESTKRACWQTTACLPVRAFSCLTARSPRFVS